MSTGQRVSKKPIKSEHGTGPEILGVEREVFGDRIDLDPFSSATFNRYVGAARIITAQQNAWQTPWHPLLPPPRQLRTDRTTLAPGVSREHWHVNPPGSHDGSNVARAWWSLVEYWRRGAFRAAFYVGFNIEQLSRLQRVGAATHPLRLPTLVFSYRYGYREEKTLQIQEQPDRASFLTLLTTNHQLLDRFEAAAQGLGHVINGGWRPT